MGTIEKREYLTMPRTFIFHPSGKCIVNQTQLCKTCSYLFHTSYVKQQYWDERNLYEIIPFVVPNNKNNTCIK